MSFMYSSMETFLRRRGGRPRICTHCRQLTDVCPRQGATQNPESTRRANATKAFFSKILRQADDIDEKGVRVNRRQCKADDTVILSMSKPRGPGSRSKNKINHLNLP